MIRIHKFFRKEERGRKLSFHLIFLHEWVLFSRLCAIIEIFVFM